MPTDQYYSAELNSDAYRVWLQYQAEATHRRILLKEGIKSTVERVMRQQGYIDSTSPARWINVSQLTRQIQLSTDFEIAEDLITEALETMEFDGCIRSYLTTHGPMWTLCHQHHCRSHQVADAEAIIDSWGYYDQQGRCKFCGAKVVHSMARDEWNSATPELLEGRITFPQKEPVCPA